MISCQQNRKKWHYSRRAECLLISLSVGERKGGVNEPQIDPTLTTTNSTLQFSCAKPSLDRYCVHVMAQRTTNTPPDTPICKAAWWIGSLT